MNRECEWSRLCAQPATYGSRFCYLHQKLDDGRMDLRYPIGVGDRVDLFHEPDEDDD